MYNISSIYPKKEGCRFDFDYYLNSHMPLSIARLSGAKGFQGVSVERGMEIEEPRIESTYVAMCHYYFDTLEDFMAAFLPHAEELRGDIKNYTDIQPVIQINKVEIARPERT
ncbi:MAG: EthD family reductase [Deltaproteobacteria bacterium]|nr:EthD family reductase [Deltaproteobacteria bacterium]